MTILQTIARPTLPAPKMVADQLFARLVGSRREVRSSEQTNMVAAWPTQPPEQSLAGSQRLAPRGSAIMRHPDGGPTVTVCHQPFMHFMRRRYTAETLTLLDRELRKAGVTEVPLTSANLVPAGCASDVTASFGYGAAWWRDTALIAIALRDQRTTKLAHGLAGNALGTNQLHRFVTGISHGRACSPLDMPQIKVSADGGDLTSPWGHNQLDALGLGLFVMATTANDTSCGSTDDLTKAAALVAGYLSRIDFTSVRCNGHWEEAGPNGEGAILTSSLGCIVHGLKALDRWIMADPPRARQLDDYPRSLDGTRSGLGETLRTVDDSGRMLFSFERADHVTAINRGISTIGDRVVGKEVYETFADALGRKRKTDLALSTFAVLELATPVEDRVLETKELVQLALQIERDLKGPMGYRRYAGDGWLAAYPGADCADPEKRAHVGLHICDRHRMVPDTSPEWSLGNGVMTHVFARLAMETRSVALRDKAHENMNRSVGNVKRSADGTFSVDELFMHVRDNGQYRYASNGLDLNWARANLRMSVQSMRDLVSKA